MRCAKCAAGARRWRREADGAAVPWRWVRASPAHSRGIGFSSEAGRSAAARAGVLSKEVCTQVRVGRLRHFDGRPGPGAPVLCCPGAGQRARFSKSGHYSPSAGKLSSLVSMRWNVVATWPRRTVENRFSKSGDLTYKLLKLNRILILEGDGRSVIVNDSGCFRSSQNTKTGNRCSQGVGQGPVRNKVKERGCLTDRAVRDAATCRVSSAGRP